MHVLGWFPGVEVLCSAGRVEQGVPPVMTNLLRLKWIPPLMLGLKRAHASFFIRGIELSGSRRGYILVMSSLCTIKAARFAAVSVLCMLLATGVSLAQVAGGRRISVGGVFGDPSGVTVRCPIGVDHALDVGFGPDYFGSPRLQLDYVWQFDLFGSGPFGFYAGPGLAIAFAKGINAFYTHEPNRERFAAAEDNRFEIGGTATVGMTITPGGGPAEFFVESGPLVVASRIFDLDFDGAVGVRIRL